MRYKYLYANKWLDTEPEQLYSDGRDEELYQKHRITRIIKNKHKYPEDYIDMYFYGKRNCGDLSNRSLRYGFHRIVFSNGNPNYGDKLLPSYGPECVALNS